MATSQPNQQDFKGFKYGKNIESGRIPQEVRREDFADAMNP